MKKYRLYLMEENECYWFGTNEYFDTREEAEKREQELTEYQNKFNIGEREGIPEKDLKLIDYYSYVGGLWISAGSVKKTENNENKEGENRFYACRIE